MRTSIVANLVCALSIVMGAGSASAVVINVDFNQSGGTVGTYSGQGAASDPGNNLWNGIIATGAAQTSGPLTASDGSGTSATVSISAHNVLEGTPQSFAPALLNDLVYQAGSSTFSFNNVPAGVYDVYAYSLTAGHSAGQAANFYITAFTVNGSPAQNVNQPTVIPNAFVLGQNYTRFQNVSPIAGQIAGTWTDVSGNNAVLNGFQLVSVVPEPGTISLLLFGAIGLFRVVRRRNA